MPTFFDRQLSRGLMRPTMTLRDPFYEMNRMDPFFDLSLRDPFFDTSLDTMRPSMLDFFDPFNSMDRLMGRNLRWLNEPSMLPSRLMAPIVPQKYRITLDCTGFSESSIKTSITGENFSNFISTITANEQLLKTMFLFKETNWKSLLLKETPS